MCPAKMLRKAEAFEVDDVVGRHSKVCRRLLDAQPELAVSCSLKKTNFFRFSGQKDQKKGEILRWPTPVNVAPAE